MLRVVLTLALSLTGIQFTVTAPQGCHPCYVQIDTTAGVTADPQIFQFNLAPGEAFGHTVQVVPAQGGSVRVRVWTEQSGEGPDADQSILLPAPHRVYVPLFY